MAYASLPDVQARNTIRGEFGVRTRPTATQVAEYLEDTAVILDGILRARGYQVPVPSTATTALRWLRQANAAGAHARVENAGSEQDSLDESAEAAWRAATNMLRKGEIELDAPRDTATTRSRSSRATLPATRMFYLDQEF